MILSLLHIINMTHFSMGKLILVGKTFFRNHNAFHRPLLVRYEGYHKRRYSSDDKRLDPIKMTYAEYGDQLDTPNIPIVIMHGLFGSKMNWNNVSKAIHSTLQRKVFSVDARNHGDSPHTPEHSYLHLAEDLKRFLQDNNIEKAVLLGHSMGGRAVMYCALTYPELVDRLIVCDVSPVGTNRGIHEMKVVVQAIKDVNLNDLAAQKNIFQARTKAEQILIEKLNMNKRIASYIVTNLKEDGTGRYSWRVNLDAIYKNYDNHILKFPLPENSNYGGPSLFVVGKRADFVKPEQYDDIKKIFPKVNFLELDAGHWVHADKPQEFITGVCDFIKSS